MTTSVRELPDPRTLLGGLDIATFLREHWQREPLLVRGAFPDARLGMDPDELAGLACEEAVESRLVHRADLSVTHGPFAEDSFASLPQRGWTLLVQDCDKWLPELASRWLDPFRFIPDWRIDDLMVSYAVDGGGVGPHVDQYDVFLIQVHGRRRWRIASGRRTWRLVPDVDLRVIADFEAEQEWVLEPGDMLYLPPGVAHDGIAEGECMTASVGFRAPSDRELVSDLSEWLYQGIGEDQRYGDAGLLPQAAQPRGRIDAAALAEVRRRVRAHLEADDAALDDWFGRFVTEPKPHLRPGPAAQPLEPEVLRVELEAGAVLARDPRSRWAFIERDGALTLYADGTALPLPAGARALAERLCAATRHTAADLRSALAEPVCRAVLAELQAQGSLELTAEDADG